MLIFFTGSLPSLRRGLDTHEDQTLVKFRVQDSLLSTRCNIAKTSLEYDFRRLREWDAICPRAHEKQIKHTVDYIYRTFNKLPRYWTLCNITQSQLTHAFPVLTLEFVTPEFLKINSLQSVHLIRHCTTPPANAFPNSRADWIWNYLIWYNVRKPLYAPPVAYPYTRGGMEYEVSAASSRLCSAFSSFQRFLLIPGSLPVYFHEVESELVD